jgi:hypothetical protein
MLTINLNQIYLHIIKLFKTQEYNTILGRWSHLKNIHSINKRIDLANTDHCGCCGKTKI